MPPDEGGEATELGGVVGPRQGQGEAAKVEDLQELILDASLLWTT